MVRIEILLKYYTYIYINNICIKIFLDIILFLIYIERMKNTKINKCKGYTDESGDFACEYETDITCEECIYGRGNTDPEENSDNEIFSPNKEKFLDLLLRTDLNESEVKEVLMYIKNIIFLWYRDERFLDILPTRNKK